MSYRQRKPHKAVAFTAALTIGLLVGGVLGSHILDQAPEPGSEAAGNDRFTAESWTSSLSDGDWQVSLSAEVRSLLTLTGAGTTRRADLVDNNPAAGLTAAGSSPVIHTELGAALWSNCTEIRITRHIDDAIVDPTSALSAIDEAISRLGELTGLDLVTDGDSRGDTTDLITPERDTIQIAWVPEDSSHLEDDELGAAEVWHFADARGIPTIMRARVFLSAEILADYSFGPAGGGVNVETAVLHELAHAVGIGHSVDGDSFMHTELGSHAETTTTDLAALAFAGGRSC
ncbi:MAG: matrixin family metalloprotease [Acidimicrobiales bacterium]|jgi:hypothetical protein|nr:matrixin family metalloprotease [Acidimicrobiales bacterium]